MTDRIHAWLDGDLAFDALTPEERARARRLETAVDLAASEAPTRSPGLAAGVMARLPRTPPAPAHPVLDWVRGVVAGAPVLLRPAAAFAAACLLVGFGLGLWAASTGSAPGAVDIAADAPAVFVRFELEVSGATTVQLAGSFSDWQPAYDLSAAGEDRWAVTVPLEPGVHDYVFIVDGKHHVIDPTAPRFSDGFGSFSNRIALLASAT